MSENGREEVTMNPISTATYRDLVRDPASPIGRQKIAMALRLAKIDGCYPEVARFALDARRAWLEWLTVTQRRWQQKTRRPSRARHHDSLAIRERYIRGV